jgi:hypothetical protein
MTLFETLFRSLRTGGAAALTNLVTSTISKTILNSLGLSGLNNGFFQMVLTLIIIGLLALFCQAFASNDKYIEGEVTALYGKGTSVNVNISEAPAVPAVLCNLGDSKVNQNYVCADVKIDGQNQKMVVPQDVQVKDVLIFKKDGDNYRPVPGMNKIPYFTWTNFRNIFVTAFGIQLVTYLFNYIAQLFIGKKVNDLKGDITSKIADILTPKGSLGSQASQAASSYLSRTPSTQRSMGGGSVASNLSGV